MPEFAWEAKARSGETRKGVMEADTEATVQNRLRQQQLNPVKVKKKAKEFNIVIGGGVTPKELVQFTRQFATMIDAGLPLVQCLDILAGQTPNKIFAACLKDVKLTVEGGSTFSDALRRHPKVFDELYVNLVQAGEMGGILDTILNRLAVYIEKRVKLMRQVKGAMTYPLAVLFIAVAVMTVLMIFVIPAFENMFKDFGSKDGLPKLTQVVIAFSKGFISNAPYLVAFTIVFGVSARYFIKTKRGKRLFHRLLLALPIFGSLLQKIAVARFTRTLGTLLSSGVPIMDALDVVARTAGNVIIEEAIIHVRNKIAEGKNMAEPLAEMAVFPSLVVQMLGVGEQTGALDTMLGKVADFYEDEVDVAVAALTSLMEPIMMVGIGGMVGTVLVAMYLPIFDIAGKIKAD